MKGGGGYQMKVEWPGDSSYLLRENRMSLISCVVSDESYFFKTRYLPCRSLCIVGYAEAHLAFGGSVYRGCLNLPKIFIGYAT